MRLTTTTRRSSERSTCCRSSRPASWSSPRAGRIVREQVLALERAGVDAILVAELAQSADFAAALADLVGDGE